MHKLEEDIFWYLNTGVEGFNYPNKILSKYKLNLFQLILFKILESIYSHNKTQTNYLFIGGKYIDLMAGLSDGGVRIAGGIRSLMFGCIKGYKIFPDRIFAHSLATIAGVSNANKDLILNELIERGVKLLYKWGIQSVITINDSLPLERFWIEAARRVGIKSVCLQHGLFSASLSALSDGGFADYILAYDDEQAKIIKSNPRNKSKILVFGYHSVVNNLQKLSRPPQRIRICFLGQPWGEYYTHLKEHYYKILKNCSGQMRDENLPIFYKPHPSEHHYRDDPKWPIQLYDGTLKKAFLDFDVFISISSTALFEAKLNGRMSIQIYSPDFSSEIFEKAGYASTVNILDLDKLSAIVMENPIKCPIKVAKNNKELALNFRKLIC